MKEAWYTLTLHYGDKPLHYPNFFASLEEGETWKCKDQFDGAVITIQRSAPPEESHKAGKHIDIYMLEKLLVDLHAKVEQELMLAWPICGCGEEIRHQRLSFTPARQLCIKCECEAKKHSLYEPPQAGVAIPLPDSLR